MCLPRKKVDILTLLQEEKSRKAAPGIGQFNPIREREVTKSGCDNFPKTRKCGIALEICISTRGGNETVRDRRIRSKFKWGR